MGGNIFSRLETRGISAENSRISAGGDINVNIYPSTSHNVPTGISNTITTLRSALSLTSFTSRNKLHLFPQPNPKFIGRESKIKEIQAALQSCRGKVYWWERIIVLHGFGGMGKSELAKRISQKCAKKFDYINWFDVETENSTKASFKQFAKMLQLECEPEVNSGEIYVTLQNRWKSGLFIFDNANGLESKDDMFGIKAFLPEACYSTHPIILVTSRHGESYWGDLYNIKVIDVEKLNSVKSYDCLVSYLGLEKREITEELKSAIVGLVHQLDGYPLGLATVGRLIAAGVKKITLPGVQGRIQDYTDVLAGKSFANLVGESKVTAQLNKILEWTIEKIKMEEDGPAALEVLAILAFMSSNDKSFVGLIRGIYINEEFVHYDFKKNDRFDDLDVKSKKYLTLLVSYSLITIEEYTDFIDSVYDVVHMHRLVKNSYVVLQMNNRNGSIAVEKIIQNFIQKSENGYSDTLEELFLQISSRDPVNINQCMALVVCLFQGHDRPKKHFMTFYKSLQERNLNPDQHRMMKILKLDYILSVLSSTRVTRETTLEEALAQPDSVVFHTEKDYNQTRRDQETTLGDSKSPIIIFEPDFYCETEELSQCFYQIHPSREQCSFEQLNSRMPSVENYRELMHQKKIYFVVDPSDALQDILSLTSDFIAQFWVMSSCVFVLYKLSLQTHIDLPRKSELLEWVKKMLTECGTSNRFHLDIIQLVLFLGGVEVLDADFLSIVFKITSEFERWKFWKSVYYKFKDLDCLDSLLNAVNVDIISTSLYFLTPERQIIFFVYGSTAYLEVLKMAVESAIASQNLCSLGFCKGVATAISSMMKYMMTVDYQSMNWWITMKAFKLLRILFGLQKSNSCSCISLLDETLLNQFNSYNNWLQNRWKLLEMYYVAKVVKVIEQSRQYFATNNKKEWVDVASKYLDVFDAHFQKMSKKYLSSNRDDDLAGTIYNIVSTSEEMAFRWSFSKDVQVVAVRLTASASKKRHYDLFQKSALQSVVFWYYLFNHNFNLSKKMKVHLKPIMAKCALILSDEMTRDLRDLLKENSSKLQKTLTEFLGREEKDNYATEFARMILNCQVATSTEIVL